MTMQPPLAPGLPVVRHTLGLLNDPLELMLRMYHQMGPVFRVRGGGREYTVLAGLEANRWFNEHSEKYMSSGPIYQPYMDDMGSDMALVGMDGDDHTTFRKSLRPGYSREAIAPHLPRMVEEIDKVLDEWHPGQKVNVTEVMQFLVAQVMGMGLARCPVDHHFEDIRTFGLIFLGAGVGGYPGIMRHLPHYKAARRRALDFVQERLDEHREHPNVDHPDLMDVLLQAERPDGEPLTDADLLTVAHSAYTNGLVYVSASSGFMLYHLLKQPDASQKVMPEIDALFSDGAPDIKQLRRSRWLRAAFMESIRLNPVALSNPRYVMETFEFAGYQIEKGTATLTATAVCHYLSDIFPNPTQFDLERYLPPRSEHRQRGAYVPFGYDAHSCLAAGVVEAVMMLIVGKMLHTYRFELDPPSYELGLSVSPFPAPESSFTVKMIEHRDPIEISAEQYEEMFATFIPEIQADEIDQLARYATPMNIDPGQVIIKEGQPADAFYILTEGDVEVSQAQAGVVAHLHGGEYFGEIGLLYGTNRTATVRAISAGTVLNIGRDRFIEMVAEYDLTSGEIADLMRRRRLTTSVARALPTLSLDSIAEWLPEFETRTYQPGEVIIQQGDTAEEFYIILDGEVEIINHAPSGEDIQLNVLGAGEYFGEIGLLRSHRRTATVRVRGDQAVEVVAISRETFTQMALHSSDTASDMAVRMMRRLVQIGKASGQA